MKKSIRFKLGAVIGILLVLILIVGITAFYQAFFVNEKVNEITEVEHKTSETAYQMQINLMETGSAVLNYLNRYDTSQLEIIKRGEKEFQRFQEDYSALTPTRGIAELGTKVKASHLLFRKITDSLIRIQDRQQQWYASWNMTYESLLNILEEETYVPEKRFDAYKDLKMRASFRVQSMKVNINKMKNHLDGYLKTGKPEFETLLRDDQKEFVQNFTLQQQVARPERKAVFAGAVNRSFARMQSLEDSLLQSEKKKQETLVSFGKIQSELNILLEEQVLILANKNLIDAKHEAMNAAERSYFIITGLLIITLLFGTITGILFSRSITRPLHKLVSATKVIAKNNFTERVNIQTGDELESLADSFNQMTADLQSAQKRQEILLAKIERSNRELEEFAQVVSHDLKAPLRGVHTMAGWLAQHFKDKTDKDGFDQAQLMQDQVKRMFSMIDGILTFSRVSYLNERLERIDLNRFIREILVYIGVPKHIRVHVQEHLPEIDFERIKLQQVFQNLLSNAIKYLDKPAGEIRIECRDLGNLWKFSILDNGQGIEEKYLKSIFKLFKTVKSRQETESTGVGLAIVQKIVENSGGSVWAESIPGKGSTFHFTVAKTQKSRITDI